MLGQVANLLFAIAAVLAVLLAIAVLVIGVWKPHLLRGFKWRYKDFEAEFKGALATVVEEAPAVAIPAGATVQPPPPPTEESSAIEQKAEESKSAYDLLIQGKKYDEALDQLRKENAGLKLEERIEGEAIFYYFAFDEGFARAFGDLEKLVAANPSAFSPYYWRSRVLEEVGQPVEALAAVRTAYSLAGSAKQRISAAIQEADLLVETGSSRLDAARVIGKELEAVQGPSDRGKIYKAIADLFRATDQPDMPTTLMMLEAAVHYNPTNRDLLFDVAFASGSNDAEDLALLHYQQLLGIDPDHENALNNAGVAAERLELPITGVRYYRRAEQVGNSLATANLAYTLLKAGFIDEATARLDEAKQKHGADVHRNVVLHIGTAAKSEADEENKVKEISKRAARVAKWKARLAEAMIQPQTTISGQFSTEGLLLEVNDNGTLTGTLKIDFRNTSITGRVTGSMIDFTWKTIKSPTESERPWSLLGYPKDRNGYGRGVIVSPSRIDGYYGEGDHPIDSTGSEKWTEFSLTRKEGD